MNEKSQANKSIYCILCDSVVIKLNTVQQSSVRKQTLRKGGEMQGGPKDTLGVKCSLSCEFSEPPSLRALQGRLRHSGAATSSLLQGLSTCLTHRICEHVCGNAGSLSFGLICYLAIVPDTELSAIMCWVSPC